MTNSQLASMLDDIAIGNDFSESVLWEAYNHATVTSNDKQVIWRYLYGTQNTTDHTNLQQIAIYIREAD